MTTGTKILHDSILQINPSVGLRTLITKSWSGMDGKDSLNPWSCSISRYFETLMFRPALGFQPYMLNAMGEPANTDNIEIHLINESYSKLMHSDFNGDQFIAEGKEAAELVAGRTKDLNQFVKKVYRKQWSRLGSDVLDPLLHRNNGKLNAFLNQLSSMWLENAYGWQPLISDIESAMNALNSEAPSTDPVVVRPEKYSPKTVEYEDGLITGTIKNTHSVKRAQIINAQPSYSTPDKFGFARFPFELYDALASNEDHSVLSFALSQFKNDNDLLDQYKNTIFNLLPLSFVFDWFVPLSKYFSAEQALKKADWGPALQTIKTSRKCQVTGWIGEAGGYVIPATTFHATTYQRQVLSNVTLSAPKAISVSDAMSFKHTANSLALLQSIGDLFRR